MNTLRAIREVQFTYYDVNAKRPRITCAEDVYQLLIRNWPDIDKRKCLKILLLDEEGCLISMACFSKMGVARIVKQPENLYRDLSPYMAKYIILAHNLADEIDPNIVQLIKGMQLVSLEHDLTFLDHIIITSRKFTSTLRVPYYDIKSKDGRGGMNGAGFSESISSHQGSN